MKPTSWCLIAAMALVGGAAPGGRGGRRIERKMDEKKPMVLLVSSFSHPHRDVAACTLAWMCRRKGVAFDAYYAAEREGGIFATHGSTVIGGRHAQAVARALAATDATVVKLGKVHVFGSLIAAGAARVIEADAGLADLYRRAAEVLGVAAPSAAVLYQTRGLPGGLRHGIVQYAFAEAVHREALAVPLELPGEDIARLKAMGVTDAWTVASAAADAGEWTAKGFRVRAAETLKPRDDYLSFTFRIAERWIDRTTAVDMCEPVLAAYRLPACIREGRGQVCGSGSMAGAVKRLPALVRGKDQRAVYARYGGGLVKGVGDVGLFDLFRSHLSVQVTEPGRPVLTVLGSVGAGRLPQPARSCFDLEPSDAELASWAGQGRVLVTYLLHSGELSHEDAVIHFADLSATTKVRIGMGVHWQRYLYDPGCVEPLHVPADEGGVLGLCEPVLHSTGFGILAESLGEPGKVAALMKDARDRIAEIAGRRFAPRGVYCYLDADPARWDAPNLPLWKAVRDAGFGYVISSVASGPNRLLFRDGDFVVLNMCGSRMYPNSPFVRVKKLSEMDAVAAGLRAAGKPGWLIAVLDSPLYGYPPYLSVGHRWGGHVKLGEFYDYVLRGAKAGGLVSATPRAIARYVRLLDDRGLVGK